MPLIKDGSCEALFNNIKQLTKDFEGKGHSSDKAREMAVAAASRICRDNGGSPSECFNKE